MYTHRTARQWLAPWTLDDIDAFAPIARDPIVMRFIAGGEPWPDRRIARFVADQIAHQTKLGYCNWKLIERETGDLIGFCGLAPLAAVGEVEIGWWLRPSHWRRGLAGEAAREAARAAFDEHGLRRIVARAYRANARSIALMERLGMTFDRMLEPGPVGDIALYRLDA